MQYSPEEKINALVAEVIEKIRLLEKSERYRAALIFGSAARGEFLDGSDIDVKVLVQGRSHSYINHIFLSGIKLDITFCTLEKLTEDTERELKDNNRIPIVAESKILFDKDGNLSELAKSTKSKSKPFKYPSEQHNHVRFLILNEDIKVKRNINNPLFANYIMYTGLEDMIKIYYKIVGRWLVSNKKLLSDLKKFDMKFYTIIARFINSIEFDTKYKHWSEMIDYILDSLNGSSNIEDTSCKCYICTSDLNFLSRT